MLKRIAPIFLLVLFLQPFSVQALEVPKRPEGYVTDRANMISPGMRSKLETTLRNFERQTSTQIVVATFPSLEDGSLEDFSIRLAEAWKVGQKGKDNGVIFLIFKEDRKMRIEVGYGLEGVIPDAMAGQIISQWVAPQFKEGKYEEGIVAGVVALMQASKGEFKAAPQTYGSRSGAYGRRRALTPAERKAAAAQARALMIFALIALGILFLVDGGRYIKYRRQHQIHNQRYSFWEWFFRFAVLLAVLSILWRVMFYAMLFSRGGYSGGRGGGGFSGGGGGFGGGGASGSW